MLFVILQSNDIYEAAKMLVGGGMKDFVDVLK